MRIVVAGALGEVGSSIEPALRDLGNVVFPVSSRAPLEGRSDVLALADVLDLSASGMVDVLVHAGGPGDHRSRSTPLVQWTQQLVNACANVPAILISTTRVLEGYVHQPAEDAPGIPLSAYGRANAELEELWCRIPRGRVLRLVNFFRPPSEVVSPQAALLPWSLLIEGRRTGRIGVRSQRTSTKEFIDAVDVARAIEVITMDPSSPARMIAGPGTQISLQQLVDACIAACDEAGHPGVTGTFGEEQSSSSWSVTDGWLAERGWRTNLTLERVTEEMAQWLIEWGLSISPAAGERE